MSGWENYGNKLALVEQVKEWQRRSPGHKRAWDNYCSENAHPKFDPNLKDETFLQVFLEGANSGSIVPIAESAEGGQKTQLVDQVKTIQRQGEGYKQAWYKFCSHQGTKDFDPARHDASTLQMFIRGINSGTIRPCEDGGYGGYGKGGGGGGKGAPGMMGYGNQWGQSEAQASTIADLWKGLLRHKVLPGGTWCNDEKTVCIMGLPSDTSDHDLLKIFSPFGAIAPGGIRVNLNEDGTAKGNGMINFLHLESAQAAIQTLNNCMLPDGKFLRLKQYGGKGKGKMASAVTGPSPKAE